MTCWIERAGGNPFFAEQIVLYLRDEGLLEHCRRMAGMCARRRCTRAPASDVRTIFIARLDRLARQVREVVQTAAVLGREFEVTVLSHMLQHEDVHLHVAEAEAAAIWSALTELRYLFKHVLLRDAAYDMQVRARRGGLHQLAGHALETVYADDLPPHYGELAYHYETAYQAGLGEVRRPGAGLPRKGGHAGR